MFVRASSETTNLGIMEALRPHVVIGGEVDASLPDSVLDGLPPLVQESIVSLLVEQLGILESGEPIGGVTACSP